MPFYHTLGSDPAQAPHRLPEARRRALRRGADGARGVHGHVVAALSHASADDGEVGAAAARDRAGRPIDDTSLRHRHFLHRAASRRAAARRSTASRCCSTRTSRCSYVEPDENDAHFYRNAQADEVVYVVEGKRRARDACSATCPTGRATTSSSTAASCTASGSTSAASRPSCWSSRAAGTSAGPSATATSSASCSRARRTRERDIRRPARAQHARREGRLPDPRQAVRRDQRAGARPPSVRRGRAGTDTSIPGRSTSTTSSRSSGAMHQPPPVHQTFQGDGFVDLLVLPAAVRLRSRTRCRRRTTTATWTRTRCSTTRRASS